MIRYTLLLIGLWSALTGASAQERLSLTQDSPRLSLQVPAGQSREVGLSLRAGDYIAGAVEADRPLAQVDILGPGGQRVKRLLPFPARSERLFLVARQAGNYTLKLTAEDSAEVALAIDLWVLSQPSAPGREASVSAPRSPRLQQALKLWQKTQSTEAFWQWVDQQGTPLIEPGDSPDTRLMTFLWRGPVSGVRLLGGPSGEHLDLYRLADTDIWYLSQQVPADTIMSYKLAPDVPVFDGSAGPDAQPYWPQLSRTPTTKPRGRFRPRRTNTPPGAF